VRSEWEQNSLFDTRIPNEETLKAIDEAEKGIGLIERNDVDDLFRKLGI
jgi:antitoxin component of RelBE/YafQ-DinJ toxin-antitoxin module